MTLSEFGNDKFAMGLVTNDRIRVYREASPYYEFYRDILPSSRIVFLPNALKLCHVSVYHRSRAAGSNPGASPDSGPRFSGFRTHGVVSLRARENFVKSNVTNAK